jgi:RNA polymerase sigma-70 factor, ECF subfamily
MKAGVMLGSEEFARLTEPFRPELLAHCYRMLGSVYDAEEQVQETLVRAWRSYGDFEGRSSLRTWLYRIATNACLRAIENRARRPLPSGLGAPGDDPDGPLAPVLPEIRWLQPVPDALVLPGPADPATVAVTRESVRLALIAALQYLPGRQRAVLILRDVLGWHAAEVAGLLGITPAAANGLLQRARERLRRAAPASDEVREPAGASQRALLDAYADAFRDADVGALTRLLREDAVLEMPPQTTWFAGREQVGRFLASRVLTEPGIFTMVPAAANGQPAFAAYLRGNDGVHRAHAIQVLTVRGDRLGRIASFNDAGLFGVFGLPGIAPART